RAAGAVAEARLARSGRAGPAADRVRQRRPRLPRLPPRHQRRDRPRQAGPGRRGRPARPHGARHGPAPARGERRGGDDLPAQEMAGRIMKPSHALRLPCLAFALALLASPLVAEADGPEAADEDGVTRIRLLPPGPGNPRNSEGSFVTLKDGRI